MTDEILNHCGVTYTCCKDADPGNCPVCECSGVTPERMKRESPRYMAALAALPDAPVPEGPEGVCWDCRHLIHAGIDPRPLV